MLLMAKLLGFSFKIGVQGINMLRTSYTLVHWKAELWNACCFFPQQLWNEVDSLPLKLGCLYPEAECLFEFHQNHPDLLFASPDVSDASKWQSACPCPGPLPAHWSEDRVSCIKTTHAVVLAHDLYPQWAGSNSTFPIWLFSREV